MAKTQKERVLELVRQAGVLRSRDLDAHHLPRQHLRQLCNQGLVQRVGRGLYVAATAEPSIHHTLVLAGKRVPQGVVCLLSALRFHELTTQAPFQVWLALDEGSWRPRVDNPPIRVVWFSGKALAAGVEEHTIECVPVRIYSPAKTVADCFKYRNKIGLDVALEALRDAWYQRRITMDELWRFAQVDRVARIMRPYLESLV